MCPCFFVCLPEGNQGNPQVSRGFLIALRNENGSNQVIYPGADKSTRKLQVIYGPVSHLALTNPWFFPGNL